MPCPARSAAPAGDLHANQRLSSRVPPEGDMMRVRIAAAGLVVLAMALIAAAQQPARPDGRREMHVASGQNLQAALDAAPAGAVVTLEPGATWVGTFVLRRSVTLRTAGSLPDGRISPEWAGRLPVIRSSSNQPALRTAPGVSGIRLVGLQLAGGHRNGTALEVGSNTETDAGRLPRDVQLDRLLVLGDPADGLKRGVALHGADVTLSRSWVGDIKLRGQDTQAVWINNGPGPYAIVDNYLEASGENLMVGGDTPRIDRLVPADILIEGNTIRKPLAWKDERWTIKNLLELKSGRRVVIRNNTMEGSWVSGQVGYGILLTPKDQYGRAPWTTVRDVVVEGNVVREVSEGIRVLGDDHVHPAERATRITITRNLFVASRAAHGGTGRCLTVGRAPQQLVFTSNTCITDGAAAIYTYPGGDVREIAGAVFRENVFPHNRYGFSGEGATAGGTLALQAYYPDGVLEANLIGGGQASRYPGNVVMSARDWEAQFVDFAGGDYRIRPDSPYISQGWTP
jgi:hypothetical protein